MVVRRRQADWARAGLMAVLVSVGASAAFSLASLIWAILAAR